MSDEPAPPCWLQIWATDIEPGDLIRFNPDGDSIRVADRDHPGPLTPVFRIKLPDGTTTGLGKMAIIEVFDPDGSVRRRVQAVLPPKEVR